MCDVPSHSILAWGLKTGSWQLISTTKRQQVIVGHWWLDICWVMALRIRKFNYSNRIVMYCQHLRGLHHYFYLRQVSQHSVVLTNVIITLTERGGSIPFSTGSTNWYISLSNIVISRITPISNLRAHSGDIIPQHEWMRDGWGHATVNFYKDGNCIIIWLWTTALENNTKPNVLLQVVTFAWDVWFCPVAINCTQWCVFSFIVIKSYLTVVGDCASRGGAAIPHLPSVRQHRRIPT